jgi:hypothetical protein
MDDTDSTWTSHPREAPYQDILRFAHTSLRTRIISVYLSVHGAGDNCYEKLCRHLRLKMVEHAVTCRENGFASK